MTDFDEIRSPEQVGEFVDSCTKNVVKQADGTVEIAFYGGSFTALPLATQQSYLDAVRPFLDRQEVNSLRISTRPDYVDSAALEFLHDYNVKTIELGIQSFDDEVLSLSGRGYSAECAIDAVKRVAEHGFRSGIHLMLGLPGDTPEKSVRSAGIAVDLHPDCVRLHPTWVLRGTQLEAMYRSDTYHPWDDDVMLDLLVKMLDMFENNNISVIRVGLQPSLRLEREKGIVAGLFHPALREICTIHRFVDRLASSVFSKCNSSTSTLRIFLGSASYRLLFIHHRYGYKRLLKLIEDRVKVVVLEHPELESDRFEILERLNSIQEEKST